MSNFFVKRILMVATTLLALFTTSNLVRADVKDYEFQLVDQTVKKGEAILLVRLILKPDGRPVANAVIFAKRLDIAPDGITEMKTMIEALPSTEPGIYKFKAQMTMAGGWQLSLGAKVQGEAGTLNSRLVFQAVP